MALPATAASSYAFPPLHSFAPFYTLQPNLSTRASQLSSWTNLVVGYCAHHHLFRISSSHELFHNSRLDRRLAPDDVKILFTFMRERGRAEFVELSSPAAKSKSSGWIPGRGGGDEQASRDEVFVFWRTLDEWASELMEWVEETSQKGSVLTVYELTEGDQSRDKSWEGMPREVSKKVLGVVVKRGRAVMFGEDEGLGVKFS